MPRPRILAAIALLALVVTAVSLAPRLIASHGVAAAAPTPFELYLDCAPGGGIDNACTLPSGTSSFDVDVVAKNNSGAAVSIATFNFVLVDDNKPNFTPATPSCTPPFLDCNPDFNQAAIPAAGMSCSPVPSPDTGHDGLATTAESLIACGTETPAAPYVPAGASVVLATVHYNAIDGYAHLSLAEAGIYNDVFDELMTCNPVYVTEGNCFGATMDIGNVGTNTPSPTPTNTGTPTAIPTATPPPLTPSVTPTGAVTGVLAINDGVCATGAMLAHVDAVYALNGCQFMRYQYHVQNLIRCLRGFDLFNDGDWDCLIPNPDIPPEDPYYPLRSDVVLEAGPSDFASIDRDTDQTHLGMPVEILAFVSGDYPVLFETDRGNFLDDLGHPTLTTFYCYTLIQDPDCDGAPDDPNPADRRDHLVTARLLLTDDIRADMHVTVTQNGHSVVKTIHVVGPPATISVRAIDGKDTIETGATAPTNPGETPLDSACEFTDADAALAGFSSPKKTALLVRALDDDGNAVAGALIQWLPPFLPGGAPTVPQGGAVLVNLPTWDLGPEGIGFPAIICGGTTPGELVSTMSFNGIFSLPADPNYSRTFTVHVIDPIGDTDSDGTPDIADNCPFVSNPGQSNNDRNFIDLPAFKAFDDTSRPYSDNLGDACDVDDDNDGMADADEPQIGPPGTQHALCPSASGATDPLLADSDGDGATDGAECALGTDPANVASKPAVIVGPDADSDGLPDAIEAQLGSNPNDVDSDDDGVLDGVEYRGYNTNPMAADTDGDGCSDGKEIASVDSVSSVNAIDLQQLAQAFSQTWSAPNYVVDFDVNKSGQINAIDLQFVAQQFGPC
jgi:hypothetical protein